MGRSINYEQRFKVLKTSYALFREYGYEQVTTRMIAQECEMKRALLHHYYDKKEKILLDIYLDIVREANDYFRKALSVDELENLDVGMFFRIFYEMMSINPKYSNLYLPIYRDAKLLNELLKFTIENNEFFGMKPFSEKKKLGMFMVSGSLSQLVLLYINNELKMSAGEVVNFAMRGYYLYLGKTENESQQLINFVDNIISQRYVQDFINCYEMKMS